MRQPAMSSALETGQPELRHQVDRAFGRALVDQACATALLADPTLMLGAASLAPQPYGYLQHVQASSLRELSRQAEALFWPMFDDRTHRARPAAEKHTAPARVLVLVDQPLLADVIRLTLNHGVCVTRVPRDSADAVTAIDAWQPDLAIVDLDLADAQVMDRLTGTTTGAWRTPIMALTRRGDLKTTLAAFARGVDDSLTVPFAPDELVARSLALLRRSYPERGTLAPVLRVGDLEIDILERVVRAGDAALPLTRTEQSLLYFLMANAGRAVTRAEILEHVWGNDGTDSTVVDRHVRALRAKLHDDRRRPRFIATVHGMGYRFVATVQDVEIVSLAS